MNGPPHARMRDDLRRILVVQGLRAFGYGFGSVVLGAALAAGGLSAQQVGVVLAAMLAGMAVGSLLVGRFADRLGRRRTYLLLLGLMAASAAVFALTDSVVALVLAALTGTLSTDPNESGPITTIEQAMMAAAPDEDRAAVFGRYNALAYLAGGAGALIAGGPAFFRSMWPAIPADQRWLLGLSVLALLAAARAAGLSRAVERPSGAAGGATRLGRESRRRVGRLAGLFAVDAFAGGFVVQAFLVFWFTRRYGATPELMGLVFFLAGLLQAASSLAAGWLAARIGLLNTMVFTHLPSNLLLAAIPFAPTLWFAVGLLLARSALSQMDVPTRQAYVVTVVEPAERTPAAAYTNTARYLARPVAPAAAGALMAHAWIGLPFLLAGGLKSCYDLVLYALFSERRVRDRRGTPGR